MKSEVDVLKEIESNTSNTASNTSYVETELQRVNEKLDQIIKLMEKLLADK